MTDIRIGDFIEAKTVRGLFEGYVIAINNIGMVGAVLDGFTRGHDLGGRLPISSRNGYWVHPEDVTRISPEQCVSQKVFEDLF